jgi:outer membrane protein assembly factor BamE (lipoprotein component of BamABCDE complex)
LNQEIVLHQIRLVFGTFTLMAAVALCGCASAGNQKVRAETMDTMGQKVAKGFTTKAQVTALYGEPATVSLTDGGSEVWHYEYAHATANGASYVPIVGLFAGGAHVNKNELVFIFDKNDIMQNYTVHASESDVRRGGANVDSK